MDIFEGMKKIRIIPVLALENVDEGLKVCERLCENGLPAAEITFRTEAAEAVIREASKRFPEMLIGAGTVLNIRNLYRAMDAGAKFGVAPGFNPLVAGEAMRQKFPFIPGVCTPGEIEMALEMGYRLLKFFPAEAAGGAAMLKAMSAPYKHLNVRFMPTGGIKEENAASYLSLPIVTAVGGTWLSDGDPAKIRAAVKLAAEVK